MDNEQVGGVLESEHMIDAELSQRRARTESDPSHRMTTSGSSNKASVTISSEETPLLSRDEAQEGSAGALPPTYNDPPPYTVWDGLRDFEGLPWYKQPSVYWLLPPFTLFALAFGGIIVPKVNLILTLICRDYLEEQAAKDPGFSFAPVINGGDNPQCRIPEIQALVARFTLYGNLLGGILSAVVSPKMGALSDRYGRLRIICFCASGALVGEVITIVVATYPDTFSVYLMLLGYVADGMCGSFIVAIALIHSYAADCTPPSRRNVTFGYFHGALFTGLGFGPIIGGYVTKLTGSLLTVFYIAIVFHLLFLSSALFIVPESLSMKRQLAAREKHKALHHKLGLAEFIDPALRPWFKDLRSYQPFAPLRILWPTGHGSTPALRRNLFFLAAIDTAMFGVAMGTMTVIVIYSNYMFGWGNFESSIFVSIVNICRVCMLIIVLPGITRYFRGPASSRSPQQQTGSDRLDVWVIRVAIFFDLLGYIGYATSRQGGLFILSGVVASLGGMGSPTLQSSLTKHVPADRTGQLLGAIGLLHALARVVSPTIFNLIYAQTVGSFSQTVFVCLASVFGIAFVFSWLIRPHVYLDDPDTAAPNPARQSSGDAQRGNEGEAENPIRRDD